MTNAFLIIGLTLVATVGDFFIKKATLKNGFSGWPYLLAACFIWSASVLGWFFLLRKMELSNANVIYSVATVIFVLLMSYLYFHEKISLPEIAGMVLGLASIYLMAKFA